MSNLIRVMAFSVAVVFSGGASASDTPDYLSYIDSFKLSAKMATSSASCKRLGFTVDADGMTKFAQDEITDAVKDGMSVDTANALFVAEMSAESKRQEYIVEQFKRDYARASGDNAKMEFEKLMGYWSDRCKALSDDSVSSVYFTAPISNTVTN